MIIALCFGPSWTPHINVELFAFLTNNPGSHTIHLISEDLAQPHIEHFHHIAAQFNSTVVYHDFAIFQQETTLKFHKNNIKPRFTKYTLYRLALPTLLQEEKVLYLDSDTLVMGSLQAFWDLPLVEFAQFTPYAYWIAGVIDSGVKSLHKHRIGMQPKSPYVNAGVLLMALEPLRQLDWLELAVTKAFPMCDQDIINKTCEGHVLPVPPNVNVSLSTTLTIPREEVRVMHYAGKKNKWIDALPNASWWYKWEQKYKEHFNVG